MSDKYIYRREQQLENTNNLENIFVCRAQKWQMDNYTVALESGIYQATAGGELLKKMIDMVAEAQKSVCVHSFLIQKTGLITELVDAQARGVKVFVLTAANVRLETKMYEEEGERYIEGDYNKMLNEDFKGRFVHRSADTFHAKYLITDEKNGVLCSNNFTENGFFRNPEVAVVLNQAQANELYQHFVYEFWERATDEQTNEPIFAKVTVANCFKLANFEHIYSTLGAKNTLQQALLAAVKSAKYEIIISAYAFDDSLDILKAVAVKISEGVKVKILARWSEPLLIKDIAFLRNNGAEIYAQPQLHGKFLIIDGSEGYIFTANFQLNDFQKSINVGLRLSIAQTNSLLVLAESWMSLAKYKWAAMAKISEILDYVHIKNNRFEALKIEAEKRTEMTRGIKSCKDFINAWGQQLKSSGKAKLDIFIIQLELARKEFLDNKERKYEFTRHLAGVYLVEEIRFVKEAKQNDKNNTPAPPKQQRGQKIIAIGGSTNVEDWENYYHTLKSNSDWASYDFVCAINLPNNDK
jgi:phosphatidylserine/phosphatidylglycerophosphate/cardiolipin synthase-like enzyme